MRPIAGGRSSGPTTRSTASRRRRSSRAISDIAEFLQSDSKVPKSRRRRQRAAGSVPPAEIERTIVELEEEMLAAAEELRFEYAAKLRDEIRDLKRELDVAVAEGRAGVR